VAADDDERVGLGAPSGVQRDAGQIDALEDVGVDELGGQVEGEQVELGGRPVGVEAEEGHAAAPQLGGQVGPRAVGALGDGVVALVEQLVEDLEALVGPPCAARGPA
jgi:hypothetical protein